MNSSQREEPPKGTRLGEVSRLVALSRSFRRETLVPLVSSYNMLRLGLERTHLPKQKGQKRQKGTARRVQGHKSKSGECS